MFSVDKQRNGNIRKVCSLIDLSKTNTDGHSNEAFKDGNYCISLLFLLRNYTIIRIDIPELYYLVLKKNHDLISVLCSQDMILYYNTI